MPSVDISAAVRAFKDSRVAVGAQNLFYEDHGAYTGEVSAAMLCDLGVKYVIVGHSERRAMFGETDAIVNKKVHAALNAGLNPIICVGESLDQREMGVTMELIALQVKSALAGVAAENIRRCVIAYEPIWAIGTGTIQYGGSMNPANAAELLGHEDIDGGLIGGASLDAGKFMDIVNAANQG